MLKRRREKGNILTDQVMYHQPCHAHREPPMVSDYLTIDQSHNILHCINLSHLDFTLGWRTSRLLFPYGGHSLATSHLTSLQICRPNSLTPLSTIFENLCSLGSVSGDLLRRLCLQEVAVWLSPYCVFNKSLPTHHCRG